VTQIERGSVSSKYQLDAIERWPTQVAKSWVNNFLRRAQDDDNVQAVIAVGSSVRSDVPSADLDLVVLASDPKRFSARPPLEIDLRTYALGQVDELIRSGNDLLGWSVNFGKVLLQRAGCWDAIVSHWQGRVPLPSLEIASKRAAEALLRLRKMLEIGDRDAAREQAISYVTHLARSRLVREGTYPASRPELPKQLRGIGCEKLASILDGLLTQKIEDLRSLERLSADDASY
jgi:hypothetical protein